MESERLIELAERCETEAEKWTRTGRAMLLNTAKQLRARAASLTKDGGSE